MKKPCFAKECFVIVAGTVIAALATFFFLMPNDLSIGSIVGLAVVVSRLLAVKVSVVCTLFNIVLLLLGWLLVGRSFGIRTVVSTLLYSGLLYVLESTLPLRSLTNDLLLDTICFGILISVGQALLFNHGASTGGLDIVAKILNKFTHMDIGKAVSAAGYAVAISGVLIADVRMVIYSVFGTFINGILVDYFIFGFNPRRRVCIISPKEKEICDFILHGMHTGASIYETIGAYSGEVRREIITIVDKTEYAKLMSQVKKIDPDAFVTIYPVHEVHYRSRVCE